MTTNSTQPAVVLNEIFRNLAAPRPSQSWRWTEKDEAWKGELDLPGFTKEEVNVSLDKDRLLVVEARQADLPEGEERDFSREEVSYRLRLPRTAQAEDLSARLENGVLFVTVPKITPDSQIARRIELN
ncbi:Hsp20/alpha crystallin family protein [Roseibacillus ishigakijimensis]|uniref:Hsp20/alpha crystallin family protein n=1 Tax=Roseibacillus ishigakijimensis TaxID=454146 RepID=A0A934RTK1_9BACT|nr:Hsp20/alpha crystallin family protein [Roseibacillus ishigakijimensis]MBK1835391.1 Hsp20/alpha crystallin family protein [Roseibacillus ishigakijimensis]